MRRHRSAFPFARRLGLAALLCLGLLLAPASAAQAALGLVDFFGNPGAAPSTDGGKFSGGPRGVAVNDSSGDVYVVDSGNSRVQQFDADGDFIRAFGIDVAGDGNELQSVRVTATAGTYTLTFQGQTTVPIGCTAVNTVVREELEKLSTIGAGNVAVAGGPGNNIGNNPYLVTFVGSLGHADQPELTTNESCTGGTGTVILSTLANGFVGAAPDNANEMQGVRVNASAGQFRLLFGAGGPGVAETVDLSFAAGAAEVQAALNALTNVSAGGGSVKVSGGPGDNGGSAPYLVDFDGGPLAGTDVVLISGLQGTTPLSGGTGTGAGQATVSTFAPGGGAGTAYEICEEAIKCKTGTTAATGGGLSSPQGVAINQQNGDLYVTNQARQRVEQFDAQGNFIRAWGRNVVASGPGDTTEIQTVTIGGSPSGGTFTLTFGANTTAGISATATAAEVDSALEAIASVGVGSVDVTGAVGGPYTVEFTGTKAFKGQAQMSGNGAGLTPSGTVTVTTVEDGESFEICTAAAVCGGGSGGGTAGAFSNALGYPAVAPVGAPSVAGNVLVGEFQRVQEFTASGKFLRAFGWDVVASGPGNTGTGFEICQAAALDVCQLSAGGSGLGQFNGSSSPSRIAVDPAGVIYTVESATNFRAQKFTPTGESLTPSLFCPSIGGAETLCGTSTANTPTDIAIDSGDGHIYVVKAFTVGQGTPPATTAERRVLEFDPGGALLDTHIALAELNSVNGMAVKSSGEPIYLTATSPRPGVNVLGPPTPPTVTIEATTGITTTAATLHGTVNPNDGAPLNTTYRFEYRATGEVTWIKAPAADVDIGSGEAPVPLFQPISSLQPNRAYEVRLVAVKGGTPASSTGNAGDFTTDPAGPGAETFAAFWDTSSEELVLRGGVNPNNTATTYYFEYGTEPCEVSTCTSTPSAAAGAGGQPVTVSERISGLQPETPYHYRVIAENGIGGEVKGAELEITTPKIESCTNDQFRTGPSAGLAECRAYEWVSNGDSWGSGLSRTIGPVADSGDRTQFFAQAFGEPDSVPGPTTPYVAERGEGGWTGRTLAPEPELAFGSLGATQYMSPADLSAVLWPEGTFSGRLRGEVRWGMTGLDGSRWAASEELAPVSHGEKDSNGTGYELGGGSTDLSDFVFGLKAPSIGAGVTLFAGEPLPTDSRSNLYEISGAGPGGPGTLRLVNRGATPTPENPLGTIGGVCGAGLGGKVKAPASAYRAMSGDGSVIHFSAEPGAPLEGTCPGGNPKRLYKRLNGATTVEVSAPQCSPTPACPGSPGGDDEYHGASSDGDVTFFTTVRRLVNSDGDSTSDLYLYDFSPPGGGPTLVQVSAGEAVSGHPTPGSGAEALGILDNSADGSRVYFVARAPLSGPNPEGDSPAAGQPNLYVYQRDGAHPGGRIAFVVTLAGGDSSEWASLNTKFSFALPASGAESDGHTLLFLSSGRLLGEDSDSSRDLYRYEDEADGLSCISCMGDGSFGVRSARRLLTRSSADVEQSARPASADLSAAVFTTAEALVDDDLNGANDVYLWREGALSLVSAGTGEVGSQVAGSEQEAGISPDGRNVFFITRAALVADDRNNGLDLYDARVGGGFVSSPPVEHCTSGEACQGPPSEVPGAGTPGSATASGPGNPSQPKPCGKGKVRRGGKCVNKKPRKQKSKHKKKAAKQKQAGNDRGGKR